MTIQNIISYLEEIVPLPYAEDFDNVGLLVGDKNADVSGVLVTLDTLENVVQEAIEKNCNLIVSFHPIIFSGLKKITNSNYVERVVTKAIKNNIAIYAIHTALDNCFIGVNAKICERLGLGNRQVLIPQAHTLQKLTTFVPVPDAEKVKKALFLAGAGSIGNYSDCSFSVNGIGSFKGNDAANPTIGKPNKLELVEETQIGVIFEKHRKNAILSNLFSAHPYEEIAYEITNLQNNNQNIGLGMIGDLPQPVSEENFLKFVKTQMNTQCIRHSKIRNKPIQKVAVLGGSGSFAIKNALQKKADIYITSDIKYHEFFQAEGKMIIADIGHYESEQYTKNLLVDLLTKKIPNFAIILSKEVTNPIYYV